MKTSELIVKLTKCLAMYGDLNVQINYDGEFCLDVDETIEPADVLSDDTPTIRLETLILQLGGNPTEFVFRE